MGTVWFFFDAHTHTVFTFQCFSASIFNVEMFPFSPKSMFLNLSYNRRHSRIKEMQRVAHIGSSMGPSGFVAVQMTSTQPIRQHQPLLKCSALLSAPLPCDSLLHKMVETENITLLNRRLATYIQDSFIMNQGQAISVWWLSWNFWSGLMQAINLLSKYSLSPWDSPWSATAAAFLNILNCKSALFSEIIVSLLLSPFPWKSRKRALVLWRISILTPAVSPRDDIIYPLSLCINTGYQGS